MTEKEIPECQDLEPGPHHLHLCHKTQNRTIEMLTTVGLVTIMTLNQKDRVLVTGLYIPVLRVKSTTTIVKQKCPNGKNLQNGLNWKNKQRREMIGILIVIITESVRILTRLTGPTHRPEEKNVKDREARRKAVDLIIFATTIPIHIRNPQDIIIQTNAITIIPPIVYHVTWT